LSVHLKMLLHYVTAFMAHIHSSKGKHLNHFNIEAAPLQIGITTCKSRPIMWLAYVMLSGSHCYGDFEQQNYVYSSDLELHSTMFRLSTWNMKQEWRCIFHLTILRLNSVLMYSDPSLLHWWSQVYVLKVMLSVQNFHYVILTLKSLIDVSHYYVN